MPAWVTSPVHRAVITALVEARKSAGMTQRDLAEKLGKPPSFVAKVELVERNLSVLELLGWASSLGVDPGALLGDVVRDAPERIEI
jgi:transcriptional regulator with XRE-family HTH domain